MITNNYIVGGPLDYKNCAANDWWYDTLGQERFGEEPEARQQIRFWIQSAAKDVDKNVYLLMLREFDKGWTL